MQIAEEEQQSSDLDWFCVDVAGEIGHFASAGFKHLPASVVRSAEDRMVLLEYFLSLDATDDAHEVDSQIPAEDRAERRLRDFVAMADRGLYSFDIETHLKPGIAYFRVASPRTPLRFREMPEPVRDILRRTALHDRILNASPTIPYIDTLNL